MTRPLCRRSLAPGLGLFLAALPILTAAPAQDFPLQMVQQQHDLASAPAALQQLLYHVMGSMAAQAEPGKPQMVVIHSVRSPTGAQQSDVDPRDPLLSFLESDGLGPGSSAAGEDSRYDANPTSSLASRLIDYDSPSDEPTAILGAQDKPTGKTPPSKTISFTNCHVFINLFGGSQRGFYAAEDNSTDKGTSMTIPATSAASLQGPGQPQLEVLVNPVSKQMKFGRGLLPYPSSSILDMIMGRRSGSSGAPSALSTVESSGSSIPLLVGPSDDGAPSTTAAPEAAPTSPAHYAKDSKGGNDISSSFPNAGKWHDPYLIW